MNVCMVAYTFYETDFRVRRYAETLAERGDNVDVFTLQYNDLPKKDIIKGVTVHRIQRRIRDEKSKWSYIRKLITFSLRSFFHITIHHIKKRYKFVHVHSVPDFIVFAALVPKLTGSIIVLDIHDIIPEFYLSKFGNSGNYLPYRLL